MKSSIEKLLAAFRQDKNRNEVSGLVASTRAETGMSYQKMAAVCDRKAGELYSYEAYHELQEKVQKYLVENKLPVTIAIDLSEEDDEFQSRVLQKVAKAKSPEEKIVDTFLRVLHEEKNKKQSWREELTSKQLMHLASKAKSYSVLTGTQRKALFTIGRQMMYKKAPTDKQKIYLNDILEKCKTSGLLTGPCSDSNCIICKEIKSIVKND